MARLAVAAEVAVHKALFLANSLGQAQYRRLVRAEDSRRVRRVVTVYENEARHPFVKGHEGGSISVREGCAEGVRAPEPGAGNRSYVRVLPHLVALLADRPAHTLEVIEPFPAKVAEPDRLLCPLLAQGIEVPDVAIGGFCCLRHCDASKATGR